jgi:hypothetical protein
MSRLSPLWTAGRLNEALGDGRPVLELAPDGEIAAFTGSAPYVQYPAELRSRRVFVQPLVAATDLLIGFRRLPSLLALLAINPEPRCSTVVGVEDVESVGPFLDYVNPLWEWLLRAARSSRVQFVGSIPGTLWPLILVRQSQRVDENRMPLPELVHDKYRVVPPWLRMTLDDFDLRRMGANVNSADDAIALSAGMLQMHDFVAQSHDLAQSVEGRGRKRAGDYWHGIHHRREPDPGNAKYWFRAVGDHPIHAPLGTAARTFISEQEPEFAKALEPVVGSNGWDPFAFVDFCTKAVTSQDPKLIWAARKLQFLEMTFLLAGTYEDATT